MGDTAVPDSSPPLVTVGVVSYDRLHYLRATLESARACLDYPRLEWIVADNASEEPGLRAYLEGLDWLDRCLFHRETHAEAMNRLVAAARGEFVLLWPDDVQFVVRGDWLVDFVEILGRYRDIGSLTLDFQRRTTLRRRLRPWTPSGALRAASELRRFRGGWRRPRWLRSSRGCRVRSLGWLGESICASGIPSLARTALWRELGPWRPGGTPSVEDSTLGAEADMRRRAYAHPDRLQIALPLVPVAADIVTDPKGTKAKVRGGRRYGVYAPPPEGTYYYRIRDAAELPRPHGGLPLAFSEGVEPIGFTIPVDARGERLKAAINLDVVADIVPGPAGPPGAASRGRGGSP